MPAHEYLLFDNIPENIMFMESLGLTVEGQDYEEDHPYIAIATNIIEYFSQYELLHGDQIIEQKDAETIICSIVLNPQGLNQLLKTLGYKPC